ncbi:hypothetical protein NGRA_1263 [Nosema granulosis]|uniref:Uncharacterized protein n=1 Tax=Nosema granulosis TaxID=83296 RepID=A0A9P6KZ94_9MICR|nr:hypothetical protein NGRA_1263 [Nosema granulosis]
MELTLSPLAFILGMFVTVTHSLVFAGRVAKKARSLNPEQSPIHIVRKRRVLIFFVFLTLIGLLIFNAMGMFAGYPVKYRSIDYDEKSLLMVYLECFTSCLVKTMIFFSLSMIIPLVYKHSHSRSSSFLVYSIIRLFIYPYLLISLSRYKYFSLYLTDLLEFSESFLLLFFFLTIVLRIGRRKETHNLFVQYETIFIYRKTKACCLFFIFQTVSELTYYFCLSIFMIRGQTTVYYLMDFLMFCKIIYTNIALLGVANVIFSKEQPIYDTLVNMYKMRLEMEEEVSDERKRFKKEDIYRLTI